MFTEPLQDGGCFRYIISWRLILFLTQVSLPRFYRMEGRRVFPKFVQGHTWTSVIFKSRAD